MIITSSLMSKLVSLLSILIAASTATVFHDAPEQHRYRDDDTTTKKTYIVTFADDAVSPAERCTALATSNGGFVGHVYDQVFKGCSLTFPTSQAQDQAAFTALSIDSSVMDVEEDQMAYAYKPSVDDKALALASRLKSPDLSSRPLQTTAADTVASWGLDRIDQCTLPLDGIATKQDATGVRVFILDTGVRGDHVEFADGVIGVEDCHFSAIPGETALTDGHGHGTHVAGTTCGAQYGVSANCQLCAVKVLSANGEGPWSGIIAGIDHVLAKCRVPGSALCVANMSLGGSKSAAVNNAVAAAVNGGVVMVVAAGNDSSDACYSSPASEPLAITVGSTTISDTLSWFSNQGPCVDVYAPGSDIISSYGTSPSAVETLSGTSMASPHVAGIAAAIRSANPTWNTSQIRNAIVRKAADLPFGGSLATINYITDCSPLVASAVKIELGTGMNINMFEVKVFSSGSNVATGKSSSQSSTLQSFSASLAVDGDVNTFSHTDVASSGSPVWWQVDLGEELPIESVTVMNRWCRSSADPKGCLCRLSFATLLLIDSKGVIVATQSVGDTCDKQELFFDDFVVPTRAPTMSPSYSPTTSLSPTSSLVQDFSFVGQGFCLDKTGQYYSAVEGDYIPNPNRTSDSYCLNWCSQNPHPDLVGVEVYRGEDGMYCYCDFSRRVPGAINVTDYIPAAFATVKFDGLGAIRATDGYGNAGCYRFEKYKKTFLASTVKIELGTGMNINIFELQVYSSEMNVAAGKSSSQSSTLKNYDSTLAVDGNNNTFSHTNIATSGSLVWWKVDLGNEVPIENVIVLNRWCRSSTDPNGCLCRLSDATLFLIDSQGDIVAMQSVGNTCGQHELFFDKFEEPTISPTVWPTFSPTEG